MLHHPQEQAQGRALKIGVALRGTDGHWPVGVVWLRLVG
jgi:hypothetical protein